MSRDVPTRTPLVAMDTAGLLNAAPKGEEMRGDGTPLSSTPQDIVPKPSTPGSQWRAAMNSPVPEAEFRKDFRSDDGGDEDEEVGGVAPSEKLRNLAATQTKIQKQADARFVTETRHAAAGRLIQAAERAEEEKKQRGKALVEKVRRASRTTALIRETAKVSLREDRFQLTSRRENTHELWDHEMSFRESRNDWRPVTSRNAGGAASTGETGIHDDVETEVSRFTNTSDAKKGNKPRNSRFPPPSLQEARLHSQYVRRELRTTTWRCVKCESGEMHGVHDCGLVPEQLRGTEYIAPAMAPPPLFAAAKLAAAFEDRMGKQSVTSVEDGNTETEDRVSTDSKASRASISLLVTRFTKADVLEWFHRESPKDARLGISYLNLKKKHLGPSLPKLTNFFALTHLDVSRNYLRELPDDLHDTTPLLETLNCGANRLTSLPDSIGSLFFLKKLSVNGNLLSQSTCWAFPKSRHTVLSLSW